MNDSSQGGTGGKNPGAPTVPGRKIPIAERPHVQLADAPDIMTVDECAKVLRISKHGVREAIKQGKLPSLILGHNLIIPKLALLRVLGSCGAPEITEGAA